MPRRRLTQKPNEQICFFFFALQSGNTWNLKSKFQVSSISGMSWQKTKFVRSIFLGESMAPICFRFYLTFTRNCSTLLTIFVFLVIFTASQLHLVIMGHLSQGILLLNALGIIICVSSVIDIWCKKKLAIFERIVFLTVKWWK